MKIIQRYISRTVTQTILVITLLFMGIEGFILLAGQLHNYDASSYGVLPALRYVALSLPEQLYQLFPMAAFIGVLLGMGLLDSHSELLVMRTAGVAPKQLLLMVLRVGVYLVFAATIIGEVLGPQAQHLAETHRILSTTNGQVLQTSQGLWVRDGQDFIHILIIYSDRHLSGVTRYEFDNQQHLHSVTYAQDAYFYSKIWHLNGVRQSIINPNGASVTSALLNNSTWQLALNPHLLQISQIQPDEMTLQQLQDYIKYRAANGLLVDTYKIAYWHRIFQPLTTLVMIFLAVPFIFGPLRSVTTGLRLLTGVIVGFFYYTLDQTFAPMSEVLQFPPIIAVILPTLLFAIVGVWLMSRVR